MLVESKHIVAWHFKHNKLEKPRFTLLFIVKQDKVVFLQWR